MRLSSAIVPFARAQNGHSRSLNSTMVTAALGLPQLGSAAETGTGLFWPSPASTSLPPSQVPIRAGRGAGGAGGAGGAEPFQSKSSFISGPNAPPARAPSPSGTAAPFAGPPSPTFAAAGGGGGIAVVSEGPTGFCGSGVGAAPQPKTATTAV